MSHVLLSDQRRHRVQVRGHADQPAVRADGGPLSQRGGRRRRRRDSGGLTRRVRRGEEPRLQGVPRRAEGGRRASRGARGIQARTLSMKFMRGCVKFPVV